MIERYSSARAVAPTPAIMLVDRTHPARRTVASVAAFVVALLVTLVAPGTSDAAPAPTAPPPLSEWSWSSAAQQWSVATGVLPATLVAHGPATPLTRGQFLAALIRAEGVSAQTQRQRGRRSGPGLMKRTLNAPALVDAKANTAAARAVAAGWMQAPGGKFNGRAPITADDAALALAGEQGLVGDVSQLAQRLRTELPGVRGDMTYAAAHAVTRSLGLRYNIRQPWEQLELAPTDTVTVGHAAWMLQHVTQVRQWDVDGAHQLASTFDLPTLGPNQLRVLSTGASLLGQPYVWAGETEGTQPEGKGGFDCSGFTLRILTGSGVAPTQLGPLKERTSYAMSNIPAASRIAREALQPGDAIFFGDAGTSSSPAQNYHAGVYMGNGWFIHSSGSNDGVAIDSLSDGYWSQHFAWGRRVLLAP